MERVRCVTSDNASNIERAGSVTVRIGLTEEIGGVEMHENDREMEGDELDMLDNGLETYGGEPDMPDNDLETYGGEPHVPDNGLDTHRGELDMSDIPSKTHDGGVEINAGGVDTGTGRLATGAWRSVDSAGYRYPNPAEWFGDWTLPATSLRQLTMHRRSLVAISCTAIALFTATGCTKSGTTVQNAAQAYLDRYSDQYRTLYTADQEAQWASNTHIVAGDSTNAKRTQATGDAINQFTGAIPTIDTIKHFLAEKDQLTPLQVRQFEKMLYLAGGAPQTVPEVVKRRTAAEAAQTEALYGYTFRLAGQPITPNQIDSLLIHSTDLNQRRAVWLASKEIGRTLKPGLVTLRDLRNHAVQGLGYPDFFTYQVSDYGMTTPEMMALCDTLITQLHPLYRELHTWARYELAKRYHQPVPAMLPADWLPNRWGQAWDAMVEVKGLNLDSAFVGKSPEWVVQQGEHFYQSLGFSALPQSFWDKSSLYPVAANAAYKKNTHASAWHMDLDQDVRSLMSVEPNPYWYGTVHHELGHIYYYLTYSHPQVPYLLRDGANRAYHEALGSMIQLAAGQQRFLEGRGVISKNASADTMAQLLKEALDLVVLIPFSAGTMTHFEHDLYADSLSPNQFNARWWQYAKQYQGIVPPVARDETTADAATKTHINDDPGQYYDYALSNVLLMQLHQHIATSILHQDPHNTDYYGNKAVGDFLRTLMAPGASRPWREVLKETTGRPLDAQAMVEYFAPLYQWLKTQNAGRTYTI